jgi:FAD/FMN-containing dehydrogenase
VPSPPSPDVAALAAIVGPDHVLVDPEVRAGFEVDWTGRWRGTSAAVVRPGTVDEVAAVVRWCARHDTPIVPQGGNTGLVAGAVPSAGAVVLSTTRLDSLGPVDPVAGQVTAGAGTTLERLQHHVAGTGWMFGVDLGARAACSVGGMVATNAGGMRVLRHGSMRAQVLGVEAVLADGSVVRRLEGLVKDNTGYDLPGLLCGSEGTLAVVTAARLRLVPEPADRIVVLVGLPSLEAAVDLSARLRAEVEGLDALEAVLAPGVTLACEQLGLAPPFATEPAVTLLVEWAGRGEPPDALAALVGDHDAVAADDPGGRERLWAYRERQSEAIARVGVPHKLDVTLPLARLGVFAAEVPAVVAALWPHARCHLFGHLGDGNLHVNITGVPPDDKRVDEAVLRLVVGHGGSISAEHGVGRAKAGWLALQRSPAELAVMRAVKQALDPRGILNPGVLLTAEG